MMAVVVTALDMAFDNMAAISLTCSCLKLIHKRPYENLASLLWAVKAFRRF